jgi:hypothetical protein
MERQRQQQGGPQGGCLRCGGAHWVKHCPVRK